MTFLPTTLDPADDRPGAVLSNGNLTVTFRDALLTGSRIVKTILTANAGKYYFEMTLPAGQGSNGQGIYAWFVIEGGNIEPSFDFAAGGVLGVYVDCGTVSETGEFNYGYILPGGTSTGMNVAGSGGGVVQVAALYYPQDPEPEDGWVAHFNFGASEFTHPVPDGYTAGFGADVSIAYLMAPSPGMTSYGGANSGLVAPSPLLNSNTLLAPNPTLSAFGGGRAALTAPSATLYATAHDSTGENAATLSAPRASLRAFGGANAALAGPSPSLNASATATILGMAVLAAPSPTLSASGVVSGGANSCLTAPMSTLTSNSGAVCSVVSPMAVLSSAGAMGSLGRVTLHCPLFELVASGTMQNHGSASLTAPSAMLGATARSVLIAPNAQLTAVGHAVAVVIYEAYSINLTHQTGNPQPVDEVTRYTDFPFNQIVRFRGDYYGVASDGLYKLGGTTDDGEPIAYALKTCADDFKAPELKNVASTYLAGRLGPLTISLHAGEDGAESYDFDTPRGPLVRNHREKFGRGVRNRYFALRLTGEDALELDSIELEINKTSRRI